jgi:hypothetical protein
MNSRCSRDIWARQLCSCAARRLLRESPASPFVFVSERGSPFTAAGLARMIERAAAGAGLELKAHPHILRDGCGYALANKGHDTRATSVDHQHGRLRGAGAEPVKGFLAGLKTTGVVRRHRLLGTFFRASSCAMHAMAGGQLHGQNPWVRNSLVLFATLRRSSIRKRVKRIASSAAAAGRLSRRATSSVDLLNNTQRCRPADARRDSEA